MLLFSISFVVLCIALELYFQFYIVKDANRVFGNSLAIRRSVLMLMAFIIIGLVFVYGFFINPDWKNEILENNEFYSLLLSFVSVFFVELIATKIFELSRESFLHIEEIQPIFLIKISKCSRGSMVLAYLVIENIGEYPAINVSVNGILVSEVLYPADKVKIEIYNEHKHKCDGIFKYAIREGDIETISIKYEDIDYYYMIQEFERRVDRSGVYSRVKINLLGHQRENNKDGKSA